MTTEPTKPTATAPAPVSDMIVLRGGDDFSITRKDGKTQAVFVRLVPVSDMKKYLSVYDDFAEMCALVTGLSLVEVDNLTDDSLYALYARAIELNDPRFDRWMRQRAAAVEKFTALRGQKPS